VSTDALHRRPPLSVSISSANNIHTQQILLPAQNRSDSSLKEQNVAALLPQARAMTLRHSTTLQLIRPDTCTALAIQITRVPEHTFFQFPVARTPHHQTEGHTAPIHNVTSYSDVTESSRTRRVLNTVLFLFSPVWPMLTSPKSISHVEVIA